MLFLFFIRVYFLVCNPGLLQLLRVVWGTHPDAKTVLLPGMCGGGHERANVLGHTRQLVIHRVKLQKVLLSKSCNWTSGENFFVNVSSAQQFL